MIPWWGWLLIWSGLVMGLIAVLTLFAWRLLRTFLGLLDEAENLSDRAEILFPDDAGTDPVAMPPTALAVLATAEDVTMRENARLAHRRSRREEIHERRMSRALRVGSVDISSTRWPEAWYRRASPRPEKR